MNGAESLIASLLTELSIRDSDVEEIYDLRDQVNALWDVVHVQGAGDIGRWTALYEERLEVQRNTRCPISFVRMHTDE